MKNKKDPQNETLHMPIFLCIGLSVGTAIGAAFDNIGIGMCIGVCAGMCVGVLLDSIYNRKFDDTSHADESEKEMNNKD